MIKLENKRIVIGMCCLILLFFWALFGFTGVKIIIGAFLCFFIPFYLILDNFEMERGEKVIFSFFIGLGVFSAITYYIGIVVGSLRISMGITFILLVAIGLLIKKFLPAKSKPGKEDN